MSHVSTSLQVVNGNAQSSAVDWWTLGILVYEVCCRFTLYPFCIFLCHHVITWLVTPLQAYRMRFFSRLFD